jgi:protein TonB
MTSNEILKADVLDILFDNRNKQYGAYTLRKYYNNRLGLALMLALGSISILVLLMKLDFGGPGIIRTGKDDVIVRSFTTPPEIKKPQPLLRQSNPSPQLPPRTRQYVTPIIRQDVIRPLPFQNTFTGLSVPTNILDYGPDQSTAVRGPELPSQSSGTGNQNSAAAIVEREPEFPGGQAAWLNFLRKNLVAPDNLEAGEKKTVQVRFIVAMDGTVTGFEVVQSAGRSFDNEVIRVLKKMPRWKPAIQNGEPTTKTFMQPVTFIGVEQ